MSTVDENSSEELELNQDSTLLNMSDDDFMNMDYSQINNEDSEEESNVEDEEDGLQEQEEETSEEVEEDTTYDDEEESESKDVFSGSDDSADNDDEEEEETETESSESVDYKAEYEKLTAPFRANGKDMQVSNVEDARQLMQMGANYNKKMAALKPNLKIMKMLENHDLLNEEKINFLIDLDKKNPNAITKLLKDSNIDPLEVDLDTNTDYRPNTYTVDDKEVELDGILDEIRETESFSRTIDVISNKWDVTSKKVLLDNPAIIKVINDHMGNGMYDQIMKVVDNERMFGRLTGLSDLEAYKQVGDAIHARGGFNNQQQAKPKVSKAKQDPKLLKDRKKAASPTKSVNTVKKEPEYNPLSMSDEEFEKMINSKYM